MFNRALITAKQMLGRRFASTIQVSNASKEIPSMTSFIHGNTNTLTTPQIIENKRNIPLELTSVLRKRRLKMKKHKLRKRRKAQRALKIKIGK